MMIGMKTGNAGAGKAVLFGALSLGLMALAVPSVAAAVPIAGESIEKPGLNDDDRARAEVRAEAAREKCEVETNGDRIAYSNCIAAARASAYREQAKVERR